MIRTAAGLLVANNGRQGATDAGPGKPQRQQKAHPGFQLHGQHRCLEALDVDVADGEGLMVAFLLGEERRGKHGPKRYEHGLERCRECVQGAAGLVERGEELRIVERGDRSAEGIEREAVQEAKIDGRGGAARVEVSQYRACGHYHLLQIARVILAPALQALFGVAYNVREHLTQQLGPDSLPVGDEGSRGGFEGPIALLQGVRDEEGAVERAGRPHLHAPLARPHPALAGRVHEAVFDPTGQASDRHIDATAGAGVDKLACSCNVAEAESRRVHAPIIGLNGLQVNADNGS